MKLTETDKDMFKGFKNTRMGINLLDYLERLKNYHGHISNMEHDDIQARKDALQIIEDGIIKLIKYS